MLLLVAHTLLSPTLMGALPSPLRHGQNGILDEVLLFGAPIVVTLLILVISSQRARSQKERVRIRSKESANLEIVDEDDAS
ncbi:MAG: hypothetical protein HY870_14525 [Chloroflexi bacterium]|nr:hypothetical protein [Chloroflexota bacterium]